MGTAPSVKVELLGAVRAWSDSGEIPLGPPRQRAVFAMLAASVDTVVSRSELIDGIWGEEPPASAEGSLYTYISDLRRALEPGRANRAPSRLLESSGAGYVLRVPADHVDLTRFAVLRQEAAGLLASGSPGAALRALDAALALWQGEAFGGIPGPYAERRRGSLAELRLATQEQRAEAMLALGAAHDVIGELSELVRTYPLRESLRALLMTALHRSGRRAEALDVYRDAERLLEEELGIEPSPPLTKLYQQLQADEVRPVVSVRASHHARVPDGFVSRAMEVARMQAMVADVAAGTGGVIWLEGEPGIGKSSLLAAGLAGAEEAGCQLGWAVADELGQRFPLRTILDCLDVDRRSADPRRAELADSLHSPANGLLPGADPVTAAVDRLLAFVETLCEDAPLLLVMDDMQWADEVSLLVWHRLSRATSRLPLLLVASARTLPRRPHVEQVRLAAADGFVVTLEPLSANDVADIVRQSVGAPPGPELRTLTARAGGNPLYVRELLDALSREDAITVADGSAEIQHGTAASAPGSLVAALTRRLSFLSANVREALQWASLLGAEFAVGDLSVVSDRPVPQLLGLLDEAITSNVVIANGDYLAFRHGLIRQALYEGTPSAVRLALHNHAAQALAKAGAPLEQVAEQLLAVPGAVEPWVVTWLQDNASALGQLAPQITMDLIGRALAMPTLTPPAREALTAELARLSFALGGVPESEVRYVIGRTRNVDRLSEMRSILAHILCRRGQGAAAVEMLRESIEGPDVPEVWKARHEVLTAIGERTGNQDLTACEVSARRGVKRGQECGDEFAAAHGLQELWVVHSVRREHAAAISVVDEAIAAIADVPALVGMRLNLLDNRLFSLQNLDRLADVDDTLRFARELGRQHAVPTELHLPAAVHHYWLGRWDEALVELDGVVQDSPEMTFYGLRESTVTLLLLHGVAALIALRRADDDAADAHLLAAAELPVASPAERENCDFLVAAQAVAAERDGRIDEAVSLLTPNLRADYSQMTLRHQWLPDLARLALQQGDIAIAREAAEQCDDEASREQQPARAFTAALRCRALVTGDPEPAREAVEHYRRIGRAVELGQALEDLAVLHAARGHVSDAEAALGEAIAEYSAFGARWDIQRARERSAAARP
ncbi:BTAD domain-containing putative transcriptional regulator [Kutzneria kofuensis]|uniref:DNA-binding SARP family transcriptional activator n=1 Tax=Kutzneria kofuensis TaxID=103725 RepID=A0A7W9KNW6_9PSEU|nr:BTAD domain-containing putative transcriptional regulator [Kutzneria kofuensis]MBB5896006.1 DNA-binding SARP family transcriptional activator [Kutzneria kofuensis]